MSTELTKNLQEKIDLRTETLEKLDAKIDSVTDQISVMENAKSRYETEREKKQASLQKLIALRDGVGDAEAEIAALRKRQNEILKEHANWMPSDGESAKAVNQPEFIENKARIDALLAGSTAEGLTKAANKIYYGKG